MVGVVKSGDMKKDCEAAAAVLKDLGYTSIIVALSDGSSYYVQHTGGLSVHGLFKMIGRVIGRAQQAADKGLS